MQSSDEAHWLEIGKMGSLCEGDYLFSADFGVLGFFCRI
jgi:hypothetical protein